MDKVQETINFMDDAINYLESEDFNATSNNLDKYSLFLERLQDCKVFKHIYKYEDDYKYYIYNQNSILDFIKQDCKDVNKNLNDIYSHLQKLTEQIQDYGGNYFIVFDDSASIKIYNTNLSMILVMFKDIEYCLKHSAFAHNIANSIQCNKFIIN